jgi:hypothetical protein
MSSMRSRYRELGLEVVSLGHDHSHNPKKPPMVGENTNDGEGNHINMFL